MCSSADDLEPVEACKRRRSSESHRAGSREKQPIVVFQADALDCQTVRQLASRKGRVEHRILGFRDRCGRVVDRKPGVVFGLLGVPLRPLGVVLRSLGINVLANLCDVFVPRALQVIPPDGKLSLVCVGGLPQLVSLGLSRRACCRNLLYNGALVGTLSAVVSFTRCVAGWL
jgi:hypothetical protein